MKSNDAELASQGRRLAGAVLDGFLFVLTLGIGWVIWLKRRWILFWRNSMGTPASRFEASTFTSAPRSSTLTLW